MKMKDKMEAIVQLIKCHPDMDKPNLVVKYFRCNENDIWSCLLTWDLLHGAFFDSSYGMTSDELDCEDVKTIAEKIVIAVLGLADEKTLLNTTFEFSAPQQIEQPYSLTITNCTIKMEPNEGPLIHAKTDFLTININNKAIIPIDEYEELLMLTGRESSLQQPDKLNVDDLLKVAREPLPLTSLPKYDLKPKEDLKPNENPTIIQQMLEAYRDVYLKPKEDNNTRYKRAFKMFD